MGYFLDKLGTTFGFVIVQLLSLLLIIILFIPVLWVQVIGFLTFSIFRPLLYICITSYIIEEFGYETFGKINGFNALFNGIFNLIQYPLFYITLHYFNGSYLFLNILQLSTALLLFLFPLFIYLRKKRIRITI